MLGVRCSDEAPGKSRRDKERSGSDEDSSPRHSFERGQSKNQHDDFGERDHIGGENKLRKAA